MLDLLVKYAEEYMDTEPGFKKERIRWAIVFDGAGKFLDVVPLDDEKKGAKPGIDFPKCPKVDSNVMRGGGKSHFLVESATVVALLGDTGTDTRPKHDHFVGLLREASAVMPQLTEVAGSLSNDKALAEIGARLQTQKASPGDLVTLKVGSAFLVESETLRDWWRKFRLGLPESHSRRQIRRKRVKSDQLMRCFAAGEIVKPKDTHPPIRGLRDVGGNAETTLIGFDKDSFCSYGLSQSANAAVSEAKAFAYRDALNDLIENHSQRLAGAKVVHWFKKRVPPADNPLSWLEVGEEQQELSAQRRAKELLESIHTGKRADLIHNHFYAMTLSGSGGRVMVRDWMEGQFDKLVENIEQWFSDLEMVNWSGSGTARAPGIERVITSLLPPLQPQQRYAAWIKPIGAERVGLWQAATQARPIPQSVLSRLVILDTNFRVTGIFEDALKNRERDARSFAIAASVLHTRMGLMKAYHLSKGGKNVTQDLKPFLNEEHPSQAYHCGRLMAVLADVQHAALGDVGAGIVQRYYAAASATPALVLGRLTRTSQFHLNKLEPGLARWFDDVIGGIWGRIKDSIPRTLNLEEQSLFALGYYQQLAHLRARKSNLT